MVGQWVWIHLTKEREELMRKVLWCSCLAGAVVAASLFSSAWYVYKNPHSLLGRCAALGLQFSMRYNPLLNGLTMAAVDFAKLTCNTEDALAQKERADFKRPEEPCAVEELVCVEPLELPLQGIIEMPMPHAPAIVIAEPDLDRLDPIADAVPSSKEPPLATEQSSCEMPPTFTIFDPALQQASGRRIMPPCKEDETPAPMPYASDDDEDCPNGWFSWCWNKAGQCWSESTSAGSWFGVWFSYFGSSPSTLDIKGDEELSEPMDENDPADCKEDPYRSYHHSGCPYTGACPYTGKMPSYDPPAEPKQAEPEKSVEPKRSRREYDPVPEFDVKLKESKKKVKLPKWWWSGDSEDSENKPIVHPEVDTMEFRPSDRSWDDYGPPSEL
jgi:hypothetical protein